MAEHTAQAVVHVCGFNQHQNEGPGQVADPRNRRARLRIGAAVHHFHGGVLGIEREARVEIAHRECHMCNCRDQRTRLNPKTELCLDLHYTRRSLCRAPSSPSNRRSRNRRTPAKPRPDAGVENRVKLHIVVPAAEFEKRAIDAAFKKLAGEVRIPGFRPGKAPRQLLEARLGTEIAREQALQDALPRVLRRRGQRTRRRRDRAARDRDHRRPRRRRRRVRRHRRSAAAGAAHRVTTSFVSSCRSHRSVRRRRRQAGRRVARPFRRPRRLRLPA